MHRSLLASMLVALLGPGCGLTLDYDPPEDGGTDALGMDAPSGGCGTCPAGTICVGDVCATSCASTADCHDDSLCEMCDLTLGACVPSSIVCSEACASTCDPVTDQCVANCAAGQSCVAGECLPGVPCTNPADCEPSSSECGFDCVDGLCQERLAPLCPDIAYDCGFVDACNGCNPMFDPDQPCGEGEFCDIRGGTFACVECLEDRQCVRAGTGAACVENLCVECAFDVHCIDRSARYCDVATNQCVGCLSSEDCSGEEVCRADHTCGGCAVSADCRDGWECSTGMCVPPTCTTPGDCVSCAGVGRCVENRCDYAPGPSPIDCDDGIPCTEDLCEPNNPHAGPLGCVHGPRDSACPDDRIDCTVELCVRRLGCVSVPVDAMCGSEPGDCIERLCVPEARMISSSREACVAHYVGGCAPGEVCEPMGQCAIHSCGSDADCTDGDACNGIEACVEGVCTQAFPAPTGADVCVGGCDQFCIDRTSCAPLPGASGCTNP